MLQKNRFTIEELKRAIDEPPQSEQLGSFRRFNTSSLYESENDIEQQLVKEVKRRGGLCEKWVSGSCGWPDRIVLLPDGKVGFVEVKAPGKKPRPLQLHRHKQLRLLGFQVYVLDHSEQIGGILDGIQTT